MRRLALATPAAESFQRSPGAAHLLEPCAAPRREPARRAPLSAARAMELRRRLLAGEFDTPAHAQALACALLAREFDISAHAQAPARGVGVGVSLPRG